MIFGLIAGAGLWAVGIGVAFGHTKLAMAGVVVLAVLWMVVVVVDFHRSPELLSEEEMREWMRK